MKRIIVWYRRDLRILDHPALHQASEEGEVLPVYIHNEDPKVRSAKDWWIHHSLVELKRQLEELNLPLLIKKGDPTSVLSQLVKDYHIDAIYVNDDYLIEPDHIDEESVIEQLKACGVKVNVFVGDVLVEPGEVTTKQGQVYKVFTPFYKKLKQIEWTKPKKQPTPCKAISDIKESYSIDHLKLADSPTWSDKFSSYFEPGESKALDVLEAFINEKANRYHQYQDQPSYDGTSRLSPYLASGNITPRVIASRVLEAIETGEVNDEFVESAWQFLRQVAWRDFAYHQLNTFPEATFIPLNEEYDLYEWENDLTLFKKWKEGKTGYPLVDAGMRQLWETGWMHNRVRMVVGSFLVKHLRIDWRWGQEWFRYTLVDHDLANNTLGWQWVFGSGFDASPYFRVFNPTKQAKDYDKEGHYIKRWVRELKDVPVEYLFEPHRYIDQIKDETDVEIGKDYPLPIIEHQLAREKALEAYQKVKGGG